jgi:hypothetical protein
MIFNLLKYFLRWMDSINKNYVNMAENRFCKWMEKT